MVCYGIYPIYFSVKINFHIFDSEPDVLVDKRAKEKKIKAELKDSLDLMSDVERNSRDSMIFEPHHQHHQQASTPQTMALSIEYANILPSACDYETENGFESCELPPMQPMMIKSESSTSINMCGSTASNGNSNGGIDANGQEEISICIVCDKKFKSKSYLKKHLRTVHTGKQAHNFFNIWLCTIADI